MDRVVQGLFCLGVAISAATFADPLVEFASNAGWFGPGNFTDHSNLDVVPALVSAAALALLYVIVRVREIVAPGSRDFARRLRASLRAHAAKPALPLLPAMFAAQITTLYGMETIEQIVVAGHPLGGCIWLGAPAVIALALHAAACVLTAFVLSRILESLTRVAVDIVLFVRALFLAEAAERKRALKATIDQPRPARTNPLASCLAMRAPPILTA